MTYELLSNEIERTGFHHNLIKEGYLENKELVLEKFNNNLGRVIRSRSNKNIRSKDGWDFPDANSSLIVDCIKV